jgi:hypothetical protein
MNDSKNDVVTLKMRFHKDREDEYSVYLYLKNAEQSVTKTVIACVNASRNLQAEQERENRLLSRIEEVIQDNLKALIPLMNLLRLVQPIEVPVQQQFEEEEPIPEDEKIGQIQDFLKSFDGDTLEPEEGRE